MKHLIADQPFLKASATATYESLFHNENIEHYIKQRLSRQLAQHILKTVPISTLDEPEGRRYYMNVIFYTHEQLAALATKLYTQGRLDQPKLDPFFHPTI